MLGLAAIGLVLSTLLHISERSHAALCKTGWMERGAQNGTRTCYWIKVGEYYDWQYALRNCREKGAELFEPADDTEMLWVEMELLNKSVSYGSKWHVYGHSNLYGKDAWRSGKPLNGSFGIHLVATNQAYKATCENQRFSVGLNSECALLQYDYLVYEKKFFLRYVPCKQVYAGFICRSEFKGTSQSLIDSSQCEMWNESEWIAPSHNNSNMYAISVTKPLLSWYQSLEKCREKGGDLPAIESAAEANWTFDEVLRRLPRGKLKRKLNFFVNLHKWAYDSTGWASSSGALHNSSVVPMKIASKECPIMHDCALLSWSRNWPTPTLWESYCNLSYIATLLVCKRQRARCLHSASREVIIKLVRVPRKWLCFPQ